MLYTLYPQRRSGCFGPFGSDLVRNAFSIRISLQFRRSLSDAIMAVELMAQAFC